MWDSPLSNSREGEIVELVFLRHLGVKLKEAEDSFSLEAALVAEVEAAALRQEDNQGAEALKAQLRQGAAVPVTLLGNLSPNTIKNTSNEL